jgi:lipopolysaccharide export system protein LptA
VLISFPTFAAQNNLGLGAHKSNAPIEINSDTLEVLQAEHKAIFTGHVVAVQGDVRLKAESMTVFYKSAGDKKDKKSNEKPTQKPASPLAGSDKNAIEKIIVENNVFLSTPEETASGAHGIYDVEHNKIFLNDNVVLTRDKNIIKGDRLVYDFSTGKSSMNAPEISKTGTKQRVKALFVPNSE